MPPGSPPGLFQECGNSIMREVFDGFNDKSVKVKTDRNSGPDAGSGFFVNNGDEVLTAYHVIKNTNDIKVELASGQTVSAHLEKFDPTIDTALLKVDVDANASRAAVIDGSDSLRQGDYVFGMGTPDIKNERKVLSIGQVNDIQPFSAILDQVPVSNYAGLVALGRDGTAQDKADVRAYVNNDRIITQQTVLGGQSGGAQLDTHGRVVGMITDSLGDQSLSVPSSKLAEFLRSPAPYTATYARKSDFSEAPLRTTGLHALELASMLPKANAVAPLFFAGKGALDLSSDWGKLSTATTSDARGDAQRELTKDAGFLAGGLALSAGVLGKIPALKYAGMAGFGLASAISIYDSTRTHTAHKPVITRADGSTAKPFLWDQTIAGMRVD